MADRCCTSVGEELIAVGQRLAPLALLGPAAEGRLSLLAPDNAHLYPPGYYMLFCLDAAGTPSVARMVQLGKAA